MEGGANTAKRNACDLGRTRTPNLQNRNLLFYPVELRGQYHRANVRKKIGTFFPGPWVVTVGGLEPPTVCLEGRCSIRLSYTAGSSITGTGESRGGRIRTSDLHVPNVAR